MSKLMKKLDAGPVICAEGYLFEMERRGYLQAGGFVPEVVLDHPEVVAQLHREFIRAGSDVVEAFTYYGHREKLRIIGKENLLEPLNRNALDIAKKTAAEFAPLDLLIAGNLSNTNIFDPADAKSADACRRIFEEQVQWACEAGVDFIIAETLQWLEEARLALKAIKDANLVAVVNMAIPASGLTRDNHRPEDAAKHLADEGADVVGLNCFRGPAMTMEILKKIRDAVDCHVAGIPVPYRTTREHPTFFHLPDPGCDCIPGDHPFPLALDSLSCNRYELGEFAGECVAHNIRFVGVCCGGAPHHVREMAVALGRKPESMKYYVDMSKHYTFGSDPTLKEVNTGYRNRL